MAFVTTSVPVNLNTFTTSGFYYISSNESNLNLPDSDGLYDVTNGYLWVISTKPIQTGWGVQQIFFRAGTPGLNSFQIWIRAKQTTLTPGEIVDSNGWSRWSMLLTDNGNFSLHNGIFMYGSDGTNDMIYRRNVLKTFGTTSNAGMGVILQSGGRTVISSGESGDLAENDYASTAGSSEQLTLTTDSDVVIYTNCNGADGLEDDTTARKFVFAAQGYAYCSTVNTNYTHSHYRNAKFATSKPASLVNGEICFVYE